MDRVKDFINYRKRLYGKGGELDYGALASGFGNVLDTLDTGNEYGRQSTATSALKGAGAGAAAGSVLGPIGTGVGAVVGGAAGLVGGIGQKRAEDKYKSSLLRQMQQREMMRSQAQIAADPESVTGQQASGYYAQGGQLTDPGNPSKLYSDSLRLYKHSQKTLGFYNKARTANEYWDLINKAPSDDLTQSWNSLARYNKKAPQPVQVLSKNLPYEDNEPGRIGVNMYAKPKGTPQPRIVPDPRASRLHATLFGHDFANIQPSGQPGATVEAQGLTYGTVSPGPYNPNSGRSVYRNGELLGYQDNQGNAAEGSDFGIIDMKRKKLGTGGRLKPLSSTAVDVIGPSHAKGGMLIGNNEVEGGETIDNGYVFSKRLGFADVHRDLAKAIAAVEKKPYSKAASNTYNRLTDRVKALIHTQEFVKAHLPDGTDAPGTFGSGGKIHIKKSKRGTLRKHLGVKDGKIPASKLSIKDSDSPAIRKKKQFAINARKWKHADGGQLSPGKALEMLHDSTAHGKPLTKKQKRYFGMIAHS